LRQRSTIETATYAVLLAAGSWYLLDTLASVLRPLLMASLLAYVLLPYHSRLRKSVPGPVSLILLAGATAVLLVALSLMVYISVLGLNEELPRLQKRAVDLIVGIERAILEHAPWLASKPEDGKSSEERLSEQAGRLAGPVLNAAGVALVEACAAGIYLVFLLLEASRFPDRVRRAYQPDRAEEILHIAGQVNAAVVSYLKAKVKSSLILAIPVGLVLWGFGIRFAMLWAVLTFLCNFIPYIGSVVSYTLPTCFAFLQLDLNWAPFAVAGLLLLCQILSASLVEPLILGRAVGLSPLVILGSLTFWGLLWGIPGMFLAVPLSAVAVIVMGHFAVTRPMARLLSEEGPVGV
jgi:AI-2 transport protein TqsA